MYLVVSSMAVDGLAPLPAVAGETGGGTRTRVPSQRGNRETSVVLVRRPHPHRLDINHYPRPGSMNSLIETARQQHEEIDRYEQALAAIFLQPDRSVSLPIHPYLRAFPHAF